MKFSGPPQRTRPGLLTAVPAFFLQLAMVCPCVATLARANCCGEPRRRQCRGNRAKIPPGTARGDAASAARLPRRADGPRLRAVRGRVPVLRVRVHAGRLAVMSAMDTDRCSSPAPPLRAAVGPAHAPPSIARRSSSLPSPPRLCPPRARMCVLFTPLDAHRSSAPRRLASRASTAPVTELPSVRTSRRLRFPSTPSTPATSAARRP